MVTVLVKSDAVQISHAAVTFMRAWIPQNSSFQDFLYRSSAHGISAIYDQHLHEVNYSVSLGCAIECAAFVIILQVNFNMTNLDLSNLPTKNGFRGH